MAEVLDIHEQQTVSHQHVPTPDNGEVAKNCTWNELWQTMMYGIFIIRCVTFSFLIAYASIRLAQPWWPDPNKVFKAFPGLGDTYAPLAFWSVMTFVLILSSVAVVRAVQEGHRMNKKCFGC